MKQPVCSLVAFGMLLTFSTAPQHAHAQNSAVWITENIASIQTTTNSGTFTIARNPDPQHALPSDFAKTSRACPPFCIQPATIAPGVATVAELELLDFLTAQVSPGTGLLVDARLPEWFAKGAIPGAVNIPFTALDPQNSYVPDLLLALGAQQIDGDWDFSKAFSLLVYGNGPWSDQSRRAALSLLAAGYPPEKLRYYRAGMQGWLQLGLTTTKGNPS